MFQSETGYKEAVVVELCSKHDSDEHENKDPA